MSLPIKQYRREILYAIEKHDVTILNAETGSGKTTQLPQFLLMAGYTLNGLQIATVLPRRVAAVTVAKRVSEEMGLHEGQIAHHVRFNSTVKSNTQLVFMTDGVLLQQLYSDPLLSKYSVIMLDDIHERSINSDLLLGFLKQILQKRTNLKLIVTSATLNSQAWSSFFYREAARIPSVRSLNIPGRLFNVTLHYLSEPTQNYVLKMLQTIIFIDRGQPEGGILVFLPSVEEIQGLRQMLIGHAEQNRRKMRVLAFHSNVPPEHQEKVFEPCRERKIVIATNVAESSLTIPDIVYVVDSGMAKIKIYDDKIGAERMVLVPCSKDSSDQRAGRAGRVTDGHCYRVYTKQGYLLMPDSLPPELQRVDLSSFVLKLKGLGISDVHSFPIRDPLPETRIAKAIDSLAAYGLLDEKYQLNEKGKRAASLPLGLQNACMLLNSFQEKFGCSKEILMLVSMLEVQRQIFTTTGIGVLKAKKKGGAKEGDFLTLINFFVRFQSSKPDAKRRICGQYKLRYSAMEHAVSIHQDLISQIKAMNKPLSTQEMMEAKYGEREIHQLEIKSSADQHESILRCIFTGYFMNVGQLQPDGSYLAMRSRQKLHLHSTSVMSVVFPKWVVYHEILSTHQLSIHNASRIESQWLIELAGHFWKDDRSRQMQRNYEREVATQRPDYVPTSQPQQELVHIGAKKPKNEFFKTSVLGLKVPSKGKLAIEDEL